MNIIFHDNIFLNLKNRDKSKKNNQNKIYKNII